MKLSASSSIIFATLALSSSTASLAAPARDVQESDMSTSPSNSDVYDSGAHIPSHCSAHRPRASEAKSETFVVRSNPSQFASRGLLEDLVTPLPIIGPVLGPLISALYAKPSAVAMSAGGQNATDASAENLSPGDLNALQAAIQEVTRLLNQTISKTPVQNGIVGSPILRPVVQSDPDDANAIPSSSASSVASASVTPTPSAFNADVTSSSTPSASASVRPSSPPFPINPPNTPALPIDAPIKAPIKAPL